MSMTKMVMRYNFHSMKVHRRLRLKKDNFCASERKLGSEKTRTGKFRGFPTFQVNPKNGYRGNWGSPPRAGFLLELEGKLIPFGKSLLIGVGLWSKSRISPSKFAYSDLELVFDLTSGISRTSGISIVLFLA